MISIHAALTGRDDLGLLLLFSVHISIHAALTGRDHLFSPYFLLGFISIHAALTGRDPGADRGPVTRSLFQSTRPSRAATRGDR